METVNKEAIPKRIRDLNGVVDTADRSRPTDINSKDADDFDFPKRGLVSVISAP